MVQLKESRIQRNQASITWCDPAVPQGLQHRWRCRHVRWRGSMVLRGGAAWRTACLADCWHDRTRAARMASGVGPQGHGEAAALSRGGARGRGEGANAGRRRWRVRMREAESVRRWIFLGVWRRLGAVERIGLTRGAAASRRRHGEHPPAAGTIGRWERKSASQEGAGEEGCGVVVWGGGAGGLTATSDGITTSARAATCGALAGALCGQRAQLGRCSGRVRRSRRRCRSGGLPRWHRRFSRDRD